MTAPQLGFGSGRLFNVPQYPASLITPVEFGFLQEVSIDYSFTVKELMSQYQFAVDVARGAGKITGKCKAAKISALLFNNTFFGQTEVATQTLIQQDENHAVPPTPFQVTVAPPNSGIFATDLGVYNAATGVPFIKLASGTPAAGQYTVTTGGVYLFASADNVSGIYVNINYSYTVSTGHSIAIANKLMGYSPSFSLSFHMLYEGNDAVFVLNRCISTKLTFATKVEDYMIPEFDFSAFADSGNNLGSINVITD